MTLTTINAPRVHRRRMLDQQSSAEGGSRAVTHSNQMPPRTPLAKVANDLPHHLDIGSYVKTTEYLTNNRYDLLMNAYVPPTD